MFSAIASFGSNILNLIDKFVPDQELATKLKLAIMQQQQEAVTQSANVVTAEINGESWLQRNWRPLLMIEFMLIIFNNLVIVTYIPGAHAIPMPPQIWTLLEIGVGGYVVGRSIEKAVKNWRN